MGCGTGTSPHSYWPYMRLAELYLIYAEALTEYDYNANKTEILKYVNIIRRRAGQPDLEDASGFQDNQDYVRQQIRKERAIELAFEEQRYFDLKRWKIPDGHIGGNMYGMEINGTADNPIYNKKIFEERVFTSKWYLYPIKEYDVKVSEGKLIQNPGW